MGRRLLILFLSFTTADFVSAQPGGKAEHIVARNVSKVVLLAPGEIFSITGEKANIYVNGWDKNFIELKITFSAEHSDINIANREVEYMHYSLSRERDKVELRNAFILPAKTDHIRSRVKVMMELRVPFSSPLLLYNKYGDTEIRDMSGRMSIGLEFSDLTLHNIAGELHLQSSYSEIRGEGLSFSDFSSSDEESKYILMVNKGSYRFNSKHSDISLTLDASIQSLVIDALHTGVTLQVEDFNAYNYNLLSKDGKIYTPRQLGNVVEKASDQSKVILIHKPANPEIKVKTTFNTITLQ